MPSQCDSITLRMSDFKAIDKSSEESFSKLKLIKNEHRCTMSQNWLIYLTLLSTEKVEVILTRFGWTSVLTKRAEQLIRV